MESLKPAQLILLSILVTFVTSIATTIITISLLSDTPLSVVQVVNQVTERERLTEADVEELRAELLAEVDTKLSQAPQVLGAETVRGLDFAALLRELPAPDALGRVALGGDVYLVREATEATGLALYGEVIEFPGEVTSLMIGEPTVGEAGYVVDPLAGTVRPTVARRLFVEELADADGFEARLVEVSECNRAGAWLVGEAGEVLGVCLDTDVALGSIWQADAYDETE